MADVLEFTFRNDRRGKARAVAIAEQYDEIQDWRKGQAAIYLLEADRDGLLVQAGLTAHAPAQVNRLEPGTLPPAQLAQPGENILLQGIAFSLQVIKCRADENAKQPVNPDLPFRPPKSP